MADPRAGVPDQRFGADLLSALTAGQQTTVVSPASIAAGLRMALAGARGETAAQLGAVLHLAGAGGALDGLRLTAETAAALSGGPLTLHAPAVMWVQAGLPLLPPFLASLEGLHVGVRHADFRGAPEQARGDINAAIGEQTDGRVRDILVPGSVAGSTRLILTNAVYLKAPWARPFPAGATADGPFRTGSGREVTAPMMRLTTRLAYVRGEGYQGVSLPYEGGRLAMAVIVPDGPPGPVERRLTADGVAGLMAGAAPTQVRVTLPRFGQHARLDLVAVLRRLGAVAAFGAGADFRGITAQERLTLAAVAHMAFIDVTEQGTEAGAATAVAAVALAAPAPPEAEVTADHPFVFAIVDTVNGLPLFLGRVADPTVGRGPRQA